MTIDRRLDDDYDWEAVFAYANGKMGAPARVPGYVGSDAPFDRQDVAEAVAMADGQNDERDWVGVFRLRDGRYAAISAWCDYSGWG